jgi:hypothetical protein
MTIRDYLTLRKRRINILVFIGMALFLLPEIFGFKFKPVIILAMAGFVLAVVPSCLFLFNTRCPQCKGNLATTINVGNPFSVSKRIKYCPHCRVDLDSSMP